MRNVFKRLASPGLLLLYHYVRLLPTTRTNSTFALLVLAQQNFVWLGISKVRGARTAENPRIKLI